jgi:hypothetical protein
MRKEIIGLLARSEGPPAAVSYRQYTPRVWPVECDCGDGYTCNYHWEQNHVVREAGKRAVLKYGEALENLAGDPKPETPTLTFACDHVIRREDTKLIRCRLPIAHGGDHHE